MRRAALALVAGLLGLAGSLAATLFLYRSAAAALERVLEERLRGAGETAAELLARTPPDRAALRAVMAANGLEGASVLDGDARGPGGRDGPRGRPRRPAPHRSGRGCATRSRGARPCPWRTRSATSRSRPGTSRSTGPTAPSAPSWRSRRAASSPARARPSARARGRRRAVRPRRPRARAGLALRWSRLEAQRRRSAEQDARGDALARMGAMVAHEIRNPLGVIRGAVELVQARGGAALCRHAIARRSGDVLGEVERLRRLTEDFLDLAREPGSSPRPSIWRSSPPRRPAA